MSRVWLNFEDGAVFEIESQRSHRVTSAEETTPCEAVPRNRGMRSSGRAARAAGAHAVGQFLLELIEQDVTAALVRRDIGAEGHGAGKIALTSGLDSHKLCSFGERG